MPKWITGQPYGSRIRHEKRKIQFAKRSGKGPNAVLTAVTIRQLEAEPTVSSGLFGAIEQLSPHCAPSRLPNITAPPMSGRLDGNAVVSEWIAGMRRH
jgi:hypothetical protein